MRRAQLIGGGEELHRDRRRRKGDDAAEVGAPVPVPAQERRENQRHGDGERDLEGAADQCRPPTCPSRTSTLRKSTGISRVASSAKSAAETSPPSMPGMSRSHRIRSGHTLRANWRTCAESLVVKSSYRERC